MDTRWISQDGKSILDLFCVLKDLEDDDLLQSDFIKSLVHEHWTGYRETIIHKAFMPWLLIY